MTRLNKFTEILSKNLEGFKIKFKNESTLMKILGFFLFFNKAFMTGMATTIGKTVYWPSKKKMESMSQAGAMSVLSHEYQHAKDSSFLFGMLYLFPQILALPGVLLLLASPVWVTLMVVGVICWSWWLLPFILTLIFLTPIPAPWRKKYELKGYIMNLFVANEILKERGFNKESRTNLLREQVDLKNQYFTGAGYYFMWPFGVKDDLNQAIDEMISEKILERDEIYPEIARAIKNSNY